jgi:aldose 1-epimerase
MSISTRSFGVNRWGQRCTVWTLSAGALEADISDHGATLVALRIRDGNGDWADLVLGFDDVSGYESERNQYFGCTVGRVANRIAGARFELDGSSYELAANNGRHHLHGGAERSFDKLLWQSEGGIERDGSCILALSLHSPAGEEGYPGNVAVTVTYTLDERGSLEIRYEAVTDAPTPLNLCNHSYWNLSGAGSPTLADHELRIDADGYTPVDDELIPTGQVLDVSQTEFDFRSGRMLQEAIQARAGESVPGFDHNLVLARAQAGQDSPRPPIELRQLRIGRRLSMRTTEPAVQLYTGNFLSGAKGKKGQRYPKHSALCLETQHYPDALHHPAFPSILLQPGERYSSITSYELASC